MQILSLVPAVLVYLIWSIMFPLGKLTLEHASPFFLTGSRMVIGGAILLSYLYLRNRNALQITGKQVFSLAILALFSVYFSNVLECWGLQYLTAAKTCFIYSMGPFFSALFSYIHFGEKMNRRKWTGMFVGFAGIFPVLYSQKGGDELLTSLPFLSWPELAVMGACLCSVYGWVLLRKIVVQDITPTMANGTSMLIGGILALGHSFLVENWTPIPVPRSDWASFGIGLSLMIFISNLLCYNLYGKLLKKITATLLSFIGLFSPIFASLTSWLILGETPSAAILLSTGILLFGLWLVYSAELRQGYLAAKPKPASI
ncbi:MAG: DMT family transporter [Chlamydiia bacterium]|nr:DMT family transporter [Chlamydiia bacterium]